jgi:UDP-N-acetylmuramate dehydrogenase
VSPGGSSPTDAAASLLGARVRRDAPLGALTTYRVGGRAALYLDAGSDEDLIAAAKAVAVTGIEVLVVGRGSNLLVADAGFRGLAIGLSGDGFNRIDVLPDARIEAGGAVQLPVLARRAAAAGLSGLEWAVGVPGSVGGAVRMNAGGHGSDTSQTLEYCGVIDLAGGEAAAVVARPTASLAFGYRRSAITASQVVVWGRYRLAPGDRRASEGTIAEIVRWRREHQPGGQNAGSVFTNPPGDSAGRLIEAAGLKGLRIGSAQVSQKHANFIQASDGGSADDVLALIREVQRCVEDRLGVHLDPELHLVGFPQEPQVSLES